MVKAASDGFKGEVGELSTVSRRRWFIFSPVREVGWNKCTVTPLIASRFIGSFLHPHEEIAIFQAYIMKKKRKVFSLTIRHQFDSGHLKDI